MAKKGPAQNPYARVEIHTDAGQFWFQPRRCSVGPDADSGAMSYSVEGAGQSPEGEPIYVTVADEDNDPDSGPELRIHVGTDQPLKTPEVVWIANDHVAFALKTPATTIDIDGRHIRLAGTMFSYEDKRLAVDGPIQIDCDPG